MTPEQKFWVNLGVSLEEQKETSLFVRSCTPEELADRLIMTSDDSELSEEGLKLKRLLLSKQSKN